MEVKEASKPSSSKNVSWKDKGKGKAISLIDAEMIPEVMRVVKRTRSANGEAGPSFKKGKPTTVDLSFKYAHSGRHVPTEEEGMEAQKEV